MMKEDVIRSRLHHAGAEVDKRTTPVSVSCRLSYQAAMAQMKYTCSTDDVAHVEPTERAQKQVHATTRDFTAGIWIMVSVDLTCGNERAF